jgi:hypothetical protein
MTLNYLFLFQSLLQFLVCEIIPHYRQGIVQLQVTPLGNPIANLPAVHLRNVGRDHVRKVGELSFIHLVNLSQEVLVLLGNTAGFPDEEFRGPFLRISPQLPEIMEHNKFEVFRILFIGFYFP